MESITRNAPKPGYTPLIYPDPLEVTTSSTNSNTLTVVHGSGSGSYVPNTIVNISANSSILNEVFTNWSGLDIANTNLANTTVTMPGSNLTVTANLFIPPVTNLQVIQP